MLNSKVMKQRSTTPVSIKGLVTKSVIVASAVMLTVTSPLALYKQVNADQYDDRINALQAEIDGYQAQAQALGNQARSLQDELKVLDGQKATIQAQIRISQAQYDQLQAQIKELQQKIAENKEILGSTLANMYADDKISPLEMLASSSNIGDFVDKQEYRTSMRDTLKTTIDQINKDKADLEKKKADTERVLADQRKSEEALAAKEKEKNDILAKTQNDQNAYNSLVSDRQAQQLKVEQQRQAAIEAAIAAAARASGGRGAVTIGGSSGGYPWNPGNCRVDANAYSWGGADGNGTDGYGYGCRQCTSYVAWKVGQVYGYVPLNWGNAYDWVSSAPAGKVSRTPRANTAGVITSGGQPGHIVWVESVNGDGTLTISQYNYFNAGGPGWGNFSRMIVPAGTYQYFISF